jgi:hypothetical protein
VLGIVCGKRPTYMVGQKLGVTDGGHTLTPHRVASFRMESKAIAVLPRTGRWHS